MDEYKKYNFDFTSRREDQNFDLVKFVCFSGQALRIDLDYSTQWAWRDTINIQHGYYLGRRTLNIGNYHRPYQDFMGESEGGHFKLHHTIPVALIVFCTTSNPIYVPWQCIAEPGESKQLINYDNFTE